MRIQVKSYTHWRKGTPLVQTPEAWWGTYQAGPGAVVTLVVADEPDPHRMHGHPTTLWAEQIPQSLVLEDGSLRELSEAERFVFAWERCCAEHDDKPSLSSDQRTELVERIEYLLHTERSRGGCKTD